MAKLTREQVIQHLTPPAGIAMAPYPAWRDRVYRGALLAIGITLVLVALAQALAPSPIFFQSAQGLAAASVTVAALFFLVWLSSWRYLVWALAIGGLLAIPLQATLAWAFTLAASSIMAAKETHCFHFTAGRIIPWASIASGLAWLMLPHSWVMVGCWASLGLLWIWLAFDRLSLPVFDIPGHSQH